MEMRFILNEKHQNFALLRAITFIFIERSEYIDDINKASADLRAVSARQPPNVYVLFTHRLIPDSMKISNADNFGEARFSRASYF